MDLNHNIKNLAGWVQCISVPNNEQTNGISVCAFVSLGLFESGAVFFFRCSQFLAVHWKNRCTLNLWEAWDHL